MCAHWNPYNLSIRLSTKSYKNVVQRNGQRITYILKRPCMISLWLIKVKIAILSLHARLGEPSLWNVLSIRPIRFSLIKSLLVSSVKSEKIICRNTGRAKVHSLKFILYFTRIVWTKIDSYSTYLHVLIAVSKYVNTLERYVVVQELELAIYIALYVFIEFR